MSSRPAVPKGARTAVRSTEVWFGDAPIFEALHAHRVQIG